MADAEVPLFVRRSWEQAVRLRTPWEGRWQRLLELAMPYRTSFYGGPQNGLPLATIYDETGIVCVEEFANRLQAGLFPAGQRWAGYEAKGLQDDALAALAEAEAYMFDLLDQSNFQSECSDWLRDMAGPGNACLRVAPGDWRSPLVFQAIPLANVWVLPGPWGSWSDIHVKHPMAGYLVETHWPDADVPEDLLGRDAENPLAVIDSWVRDLKAPGERWNRCIHIEGRCLLAQTIQAGEGSCEYIFARWNKGPGELYGAGQGMQALPAIETVNQLMSALFRNAEMNLAGLWQAEDDGVLNPWAVQLLPGAIIPIAPGSKGLQPLMTQQANRFDLSQITLEEQRHAIRKALYAEPLGKREGTPPTALEIDERMAELARMIGPSYWKVWTEAGIPLLHRIRHILDRKGLARLPHIDGRSVRALPTSMLARQQRVQEAKQINDLLAALGQLYGPAASATLVPAERYVRHMARLLGVPADLLYSPEEIQQNAEQAGNILAQAGAGGGEGMATLAPLLGALGAKR